MTRTLGIRNLQQSCARELRARGRFFREFMPTRKARAARATRASLNYDAIKLKWMLDAFYAAVRGMRSKC
jgi:hypothetical protein